MTQTILFQISFCRLNRVFARNIFIVNYNFVKMQKNVICYATGFSYLLNTFGKVWFSGEFKFYRMLCVIIYLVDQAALAVHQPHFYHSDRLVPGILSYHVLLGLQLHPWNREDPKVQRDLQCRSTLGDLLTPEVLALLSSRLYLMVREVLVHLVDQEGLEVLILFRNYQTHLLCFDGKSILVNSFLMSSKSNLPKNAWA